MEDKNFFEKSLGREIAGAGPSLAKNTWTYVALTPSSEVARQIAPRQAMKSPNSAQTSEADWSRIAFQWGGAGLALAVAFGAGLEFGEHRQLPAGDGGAKPASAKSAHMALSHPMSASTVAATGGSGLPGPEHPWDPNGRLGRIFKQSTGGNRNLALAALIANTPANQLGVLIEEARQCPHTTERDFILRTAYAKWAAEDPQAALAHASVIANRDGNSGLVRGVFAAWTGKDPHAALAAALSYPNASYSEDFVYSVLTTWVQGDGAQEAFSTLQSLGLDKTSADTTRTFFDRWAREDPSAAWAAVGQISDPSIRQSSQNSIITNMALQNPAAAWQALQSAPGSQGLEQARSSVFEAWGRQDPQAAIAALAAMPADAHTSDEMSSLANGWAETQPEQALAWAAGLPAGPERTSVMSEALDNFSITQPQAAAAYVASLPDGPERNTLAQTVVKNWADSDPATALAWLAKNPEVIAADASTNSETGHAQFVINGVTVTSNTVWSSQGNTMFNVSNSPVQTAVSNLSRQDPAAALTWVDQNLTGANHDKAAWTALQLYINTNPAQAAAYVGQLPDGTLRYNAERKLTQVQNLPSSP